jgi:ribosomal protein S18 acetylase RimI-like enzyme
MKIRQITQSDLAAVRKLDGFAWAGLYAPFKKRTKKYRTLVNLATNWGDDPEGCFVAEENGDLLGYIFCHVWGSLGLIGTFGVSPPQRGTGIGRKLLERSIKHLESNRCTTIGLETRPDNAYNVGLYLAHGFRPKYLTLVMERSVTIRAVRGRFVEWSRLGRSGRETVADKLLSICHAVQPGLDYVKMGELRAVNGEGEIVALGKKNDPLGFAVVRTAPRFVREKFTDAFVEAMAARSGSEGEFIGMVRTLEGLARKWNKRALVLPVNSSDWSLIRILLWHGFRLRRSLLRMIYKERAVNRGTVNMSFWAM